MHFAEFIVDASNFSLDALEIYSQYLASLKEKQIINDTRNAVIRYFIPSVGGPVPSTKKGRPVTPEEVNEALQFLKTVPLKMLANAPDWAAKTLEELDSAPSQRERVRKDLKNLVYWARERDYLPVDNPIPGNLCNHIKVGLYAGLPLVHANAQQIFERFLHQINDEALAIDATNAIIRFFVPGCGGPAPFYKPALDVEIQASFEYLRTVPLEYLNEAIQISTDVLQVQDYSDTHGTRIRNALRHFLKWARTEKYLPDASTIAPWGGELLSKADSRFEPLQGKEALTSFELYQQYCNHIRESSGKEAGIKSLQTAVIHYLVPVLDGPVPSDKRATFSEVQAGLEHLQTIPIEQLLSCIDQSNTEPSFWNQATSIHRPLYSQLKRWQHWILKQYCQNETEEELVPEFNTFYTPGIKHQQSKPGQKLHKDSCPTHALCAKEFLEDYINPILQSQFDSYQKWRRTKDVTPGGIKVEIEQIRQIMGWLHRYESVELEDLRFEKMIAKSKLLFQASDYQDYNQYLYQKESGIQAARSQAEQDKQRVERYLDFTGSNPNSQARRLFIVLSMAKFLYRDLIGLDDFPIDRDIPILRRLLDLQAEKKKKGKYTPQTVSYGETSVSWEEAVAVMEKVRRRVEQIAIYRKVQSRKGYAYTRRPDSAIAKDLQRFLSIAFCLLIPSRSRTFYDLRIGETLKEGILTEKRFLDIQKLKDRDDWEQCKDGIRFYIHHMGSDFKTGKSMTPTLLESGGWWAEIPNISFGEISLYDYIHRWLKWGREAEGPTHHNFFFRLADSPRPLDGQAWRSRIKTIFERWTGVPVPPKNIRKMFASQFPEHEKSAALLLQHSERVHTTHYDMRQTVAKMQPVMNANQHFIERTLRE